VSGRKLRASFLGASFMLAVSAADAAPAALAPGYTPPSSSDEAGLWLEGAQFEKDLQQSALVIRDEALNTYMKKLVCDLAGPQCGLIRVFIVNDPTFNAFVLPNGTTVVQTGLLLRMENEAQLSMVLGHEITHFLKRHSLDRLQSTRNTAGALAILSFGLGQAVTLAQLIAMGALASYNRDQEREADAGGFELAVGRGYDPRQGSLIWAYLESEEASNPNRKGRPLFFASHPANKERLDTLKSRAEEMEVQTHAAELGTDAYRAAIKPFRTDWLEQELNRGEPNETITLVQRLIKSDPAAGELQYFLGEAYRRRNAKGDPESAIAAYRAAIAGMGAPLATHRSLGLVALKSGDKTTAREAFRQYLALAPEASDRATVEYYLKTVGE
jgi:predicted Zn-dependent protease